MSDDDSSASSGAFFVLVQQFRDSLEAVREVGDAVSEPLAALDSDRTFDVRFPVSSKEKHDELVEMMRQYRARVATSDGTTSRHELEGDFEEFERFLRELIVALRDEPQALEELVRSLSRTRTPRAEIVRSSLLVTAISAFETLIAGLATQHYRLFPSAVGGTEKEFSLEDLRALGTIEDARDVAIAKRVEALLFGSFEDWMKWFDKRLGIDSVALAADWPSLFEAIQRRHVIVHSAGHVSRLYILRMEPYGGDIPEVGERLPVSTVYLDAALDELTVLGMRLAGVAWAKWDRKAGDNPAKQLSDLSYDALVQQNWSVARALATSCTDLALKEMTRQIGKCNQLIALKYQSGIDAIRSEISGWDVSALNPVFAMAKAALLDDDLAVAEILPGLVEGELVDVKSVDEWPLLRSFRESDKFAATRAAIDDLVARPPDTSTIRGASTGTDEDLPRAAGQNGQPELGEAWPPTDLGDASAPEPSADRVDEGSAEPGDVPDELGDAPGEPGDVPEHDA